MTWKVTITGRDWTDLSEVWGLPFWSEVRAYEEESVHIRKLLGILSVLCLMWIPTFPQPQCPTSVFSTRLMLLCEPNAREGGDHGRWGPVENGFSQQEKEKESDGRPLVPAHYGATARESCCWKSDKTIGSKNTWLKMVYQIQFYWQRPIKILSFQAYQPFPARTPWGTVVVPIMYQLIIKLRDSGKVADFIYWVMLVKALFKNHLHLIHVYICLCNHIWMYRNEKHMQSTTLTDLPANSSVQNQLGKRQQKFDVGKTFAGI